MNTTAMLRKRNMLSILEAVKKHGPVSRPEIARLTHLTSVTVSTLIGELMKKRIVSEQGLTSASTGGRKAVLYRFNADAFYIVGVCVRISLIRIDLYDLDANCVLNGRAVPILPGQSVEDVISDIARSINALVADAGEREVIGAGIAVPGRVDHSRGLIYNLPNLKEWINIPLKTILEAETGLNTHIVRDVNAHLAYLKWHDALEGEDNAVYFDIEEGIGASILVNGSVHFGDHGLAGEIGHATLNPDGPLCNCGNRGCAEVYMSHRALLGYFREALEARGNASEYEELMKNESSAREKVRILSQLASDRNETALSVFEQAAKYVVAFILNIINTYDPALIMIECFWLKQNKRLFDSIVSEVFKRTLFLGRNDLKILLCAVEDIYSKSASMIVLEQVFSDLNNNRFID